MLSWESMAMPRGLVNNGWLFVSFLISPKQGKFGATVSYTTIFFSLWDTQYILFYESMAIMGNMPSLFLHAAILRFFRSFRSAVSMSMVLLPALPTYILPIESVASPNTSP